ncbi:MAG TPA: hypothetical protein VMW45_01535 [Dehalococcoidia bacterium]|nr:hypothetical protein [Dehalococcoidia bacterium]
MQVHKEVSRVISNLHPAVLDTLGLLAAVRRHAHSRLQPLNINVTVEVKGTEMRFPSDVEAALFRVVQGTIGNIVEHSKAKNASIVLVYQPDEFSLSISDDGQGFDVSKILAHTALPPSHCQALTSSLQIFVGLVKSSVNWK